MEYARILFFSNIQYTQNKRCICKWVQEKCQVTKNLDGSWTKINDKFFKYCQQLKEPSRLSPRKGRSSFHGESGAYRIDIFPKFGYHQHFIFGNKIYSKMECAQQKEFLVNSIFLEDKKITHQKAPSKVIYPIGGGWRHSLLILESKRQATTFYRFVCLTR